MFLEKQEPEKTQLDLAIEGVFSEMAGYDADSKEYKKMVARLTELYAIKASNAPDRVSKETMTIVLGNVLGIVLILHYEKLNVVTSKALNFLFKLR